MELQPTLPGCTGPEEANPSSNQRSDLIEVGMVLNANFLLVGGVGRSELPEKIAILKCQATRTEE